MDILTILSNNSTENPKPSSGSSKNADAMKAFVDLALRDHGTEIQSQIDLCKPASEGDLYEIFRLVADEVFTDGEVDWGRIGMIYTLAAAIAKRGSLTLSKDTLAILVARVVIRHSAWIEKHGGLQGFAAHISSLHQKNLIQTISYGALFCFSAYGLYRAVRYFFMW